ncbi:hypothetical protein [Halorubellus sp. PRR65]|uniref:hypothetical protein n=1 Tax=Halorubellus sp. PRR65 TaxID=3098148 RepID=UPI002B26378B|nr:hypothetical protein [Halorubellus sp. PRR65]
MMPSNLYALLRPTVRDVVLQTTGGGGTGSLVVGVVALVVGVALGAVGYRFVGDDGQDPAVRRVADTLSVQPEGRAVHDGVTDLTSATDDLLRAAADQGVVETSQGRTEALESFASAVARGRVDLVESDGRGRSASGPAGASAGGSDGGAVSAAAASVQANRSPRSPTAQTLLDALGDGRVDERLARDAVEDAVDGLEAAHGVMQAVERTGDVTVGAEGDAFAERLRDVDGSLARTLEPIAADVASMAAESERSRSGTGAPADTGSEERVVADAVSALEARTTPQSAAATGLLDALGDPSSTPQGRVEGALTTAVGALDEHARTRDALERVDADEVVAVANEVKRDLDPDQRVEAAVLERVADLVDDAERTDERVEWYGAYHELVFYRDTLVPTLESSRAESTDDAQPSDLVASVADRIDEVEGYYERRDDHNHTIPRHFVSLARSLHEDGRSYASTDPDRARGLLTAADALLEHVEDLYERNQYSIMLRRLRG